MKDSQRKAMFAKKKIKDWHGNTAEVDENKRDKNGKIIYSNIKNINSVINHEVPNIQNNAGYIKDREERFMKKGIHYDSETLLRSINDSVEKIRKAKEEQ